MLTLAPGILDEIVEHAKNCYPAEGCGLIAGSSASMTGIRFIPMANVAQGAAEFEMDPAELIRALKDLRNADERLLAIYHSHPHGPARPSKTDVERAYYPEAAHLIVSLAERERPQVAGFRIIDGEILEIEVHAIV
jgi:proteasome lid subunit RPN8/RPN11